ncbi:MAG: hypothetical protein QNJ92_06860 [Alphaproteobacteria bacterium]|nr:hypothetical protein [Alphaproteobacteria bacterium]
MNAALLALMILAQAQVPPMEPPAAPKRLDERARAARAEHFREDVYVTPSGQWWICRRGLGLKWGCT